MREFRSVLCVGLGSLGSYLARELIRSPIFCDMYYCFVDSDKVEAKNLRNQIYTSQGIGNPKVYEISKLFPPCWGYSLKFDRIENVADWVWGFSSFFIDWDIVIIAVDNMATRKFIFERFKVQAKPDSLLVDLRGSGRQLSLYFIDKNQEKNVGFYEQTLYKDEDVQEPGCDADITQKGALICAALAVDTLYNIINGIPYLRETIFDIRKTRAITGG